MSFKSKIEVYVQGSGLFWFMVGAVVLMAGAYLFAVNRTIVLVAERRAVEIKITDHKNELADLESKYISEKGEVTIELAQSLGYGDATDIIYMPIKAVSLLPRQETIQ